MIEDQFRRHSDTATFRETLAENHCLTRIDTKISQGGVLINLIRRNSQEFSENYSDRVCTTVSRGFLICRFCSETESGEGRILQDLTDVNARLRRCMKHDVGESNVKALERRLWRMGGQRQLLRTIKPKRLGGENGCSNDIEPQGFEEFPKTRTPDLPTGRPRRRPQRNEQNR